MIFGGFENWKIMTTPIKSGGLVGMVMSLLILISNKRIFAVVPPVPWLKAAP